MAEQIVDSFCVTQFSKWKERSVSLSLSSSSSSSWREKQKRDLNGNDERHSNKMWPLSNGCSRFSRINVFLQAYAKILLLHWRRFIEYAEGFQEIIIKTQKLISSLTSDCFTQNFFLEAITNEKLNLINILKSHQRQILNSLEDTHREADFKLITIFHSKGLKELLWLSH